MNPDKPQDTKLAQFNTELSRLLAKYQYTLVANISVNETIPPLELAEEIKPDQKDSPEPQENEVQEVTE